MNVSKWKIGLAVILLSAAVAIPLFLQQQARQRLEQDRAALQLQTEQIKRLAAENERLSSQVARTTAPKAPATTNDPSREVLRLRGEVGRLKQEIASEKAVEKTNGPSVLSGLTQDPGMRKLIRDQQKAALGMIYSEFGKRQKLPTEQGSKLADLLADNVMENIDHITTVLSDPNSSQNMEILFAQQEATLNQQVKDLLGADGFAQYQDYTRNLASYLTAEQFKGMMTGEAPAKDEKSKQLYGLMQEETRQALTRAGLSEDFQTVPSLNFRNIASEQEAQKNLKLLDSIYERVAERAGSFLSPEELGKFTTFRTNAINANTMALALNRKMMAPAKK